MTGQAKDIDPDAGKNPAAVELDRKGGLIGGNARASELSAERRKEISAQANKARWKDKKS